MMKYQVVFRATEFYSVIVSAENEEDAIEAAEEMIEDEPENYHLHNDDEFEISHVEELEDFN